MTSDQKGCGRRATPLQVGRGASHRNSCQMSVNALMILCRYRLTLSRSSWQCGLVSEILRKNVNSIYKLGSILRREGNTPENFRQSWMDDGLVENLQRKQNDVPSIVSSVPECEAGWLPLGEGFGYPLDMAQSKNKGRWPCRTDIRA